MLLTQSACGAAQLDSHFQAYGELGAAKPSGPSVAAAEDVRVFMGMAPDGFSLRENELTVEEGYGHEVLGRVFATRGLGLCDVGDISPELVGEALRSAAFPTGANAVIYAQSDVAESASGAEQCQIIRNNGGRVGSGWAVQLKEGQ
ncbi:MAG: hypothetical protein AAF219_11375 [Myxococcota bacterium]